MSKITLRQLRALSSVISTGTVSQAAKHISISQPALSQLIISLESVSGLDLFIRENKRLVPTKEAYLLNDYAQELLSGLTEIENIAEEIRMRRRGVLTVAVAPPFASSFVPQVLASYMNGRSDIEIAFPSARPNTLFNWVAQKKCDFGLSVGGEYDHAEVEKHAVFDIPLACSLPPGHALSAKSVITPELLDGENLILFCQPSYLTNEIEITLKNHRVVYTNSVTATTSETICNFTSNGVGIGFINPTIGAIYEERGLIVMKPFAPEIPFEASILVPKSDPISLLAAEVIDLIRGELTKYRIVTM